MPGTIDPLLIKTYYPTSHTNGGSINTSDELISGQEENLFLDISNALRISGGDTYRKMFIRNENSVAWNDVKVYISSNSLASNVQYSIAAGTSDDVLADARAYTYVTPDSLAHADAISLGSIPAGGAAAIWIKETVTPGGLGYTDNSFTIGYGST